MSVFQRNGHWYLSVTVNGNRVRKCIKEARTKRQAEQAERLLRDEIYDKRFGSGGQKLFSDFVESSYKPNAKDNKKGYTVELSVLKVLLETFGKQRLCEITPEAVENFKRLRAAEITSRGTKRAKSTVNRDIAVLSAVFNLAKNFGEIKENPVSNVKYYTDLASRERILSDIEETQLFECIKDDILFCRQIETLLYTGIRRGELFNLEWRDIDLTDGFINLRKETTKTEKARTVPMLSNVRKIFEDLKNEAGEVPPKQKLFVGISSQTTRFSIKFREICDTLNWQDLTVHSLRHTFSTRANKYNVDAFAQKALLGHSKLTMTDRYTHPTKETLKASLDGFQQQINRKKDTKQKQEKEKLLKCPNLLEFKKD
jgi:integrase